VETAIGVGEEDPGVFVKRLPRLPDVAIVEPIDVQLNKSHDLVVIRRHSSHVRCSLAMREPYHGLNIFQPIARRPTSAACDYGSGTAWPGCRSIVSAHTGADTPESLARDASRGGDR